MANMDPLKISLLFIVRFIHNKRDNVAGAIGALFIDDANRHVWIANFHVHPEMRRKGIGRSLWSRLWNKLMGYTSLGIGSFNIGLTCYHLNPIMPLYLAHGFKPVEHSFGVESSDWDLLIYRGIVQLSHY